MAALTFNDAHLKDSWNSERISERLRFVLRSLGVKYDGIVVTCLDRDKKHNKSVGGVLHSKHVPENNWSGKCEAADFVLVNSIPPADVLSYCKDHLHYVDVIYHDVGSGKHFHLECDPPKALHVEIV